MKVIIVDDEIDLCFVLEAEVLAMGHEVETFQTAHEAMRYFENSTADAIICDYHMPRMGGLELFNWLKQNNRDIPFVILTGEPSVNQQKLFQEGIFAVLFKPQDIGNLENCLNKIYSRHT